MDFGHAPSPDSDLDVTTFDTPSSHKRQLSPSAEEPPAKSAREDGASKRTKSQGQVMRDIKEPCKSAWFLLFHFYGLLVSSFSDSQAAKVGAAASLSQGALFAAAKQMFALCGPDVCLVCL